MNKEERAALKKAYANRHPEMGIVCWKCGERMWIAKSKDTKADFNSTSFQLKLGSWPNKEMQATYNTAQESFQWEVLKELDYKELADDHEEDLELLYLEAMEEHPNAKAMRVGKH